MQEESRVREVYFPRPGYRGAAAVSLGIQGYGTKGDDTALETAYGTKHINGIKGGLLRGEGRP